VFDEPNRRTEATRDAALLARLEEALADAARAAGDRLDHRRGCPACCIGPFPITALDARRLARGLKELEARAPERADAVRARARAAAAEMAASFPGDPKTGILTDDEAAEERFCEEWAERPCPALDPDSGRCELYAHRPLSCRSYGLPVRIGSQDLPACALCFQGTDEDAELCRARLDRQGEEGALLDQPATRGIRGETIVAFAMAGER
jgi:Fe-S-cluster containining protein